MTADQLLHAAKGYPRSYLVPMESGDTLHISYDDLLLALRANDVAGMVEGLLAAKWGRLPQFDGIVRRSVAATMAAVVELIQVLPPKASLNVFVKAEEPAPRPKPVECWVGEMVAKG